MFSANSGGVDKSGTTHRQSTVQAGGQNVRPPNLEVGSDSATRPLEVQGGRGWVCRDRLSGRLSLSLRQPAEEMNEKKEEMKMKTENGEANLDIGTLPLQGQGERGWFGLYRLGSGHIRLSRRQPAEEMNDKKEEKKMKTENGENNSIMATRSLQGPRGWVFRDRLSGRLSLSLRQPAEEMNDKKEEKKMKTENGENNSIMATRPLQGQVPRGWVCRDGFTFRRSLSCRQPAEEMNGKTEEKKIKTENGEANLDIATRSIQGQGLQGAGGGRCGPAEEMPNEKYEEMKIKTENGDLNSVVEKC